MNVVYWGLLSLFGLLGVWHSLSPSSNYRDTRTGAAAFVLYVLLILIGVREFLG